MSCALLFPFPFDVDSWSNLVSPFSVSLYEPLFVTRPKANKSESGEGHSSATPSPSKSWVKSSQTRRTGSGTNKILLGSPSFLELFGLPRARAKTQNPSSYMPVFESWTLTGFLLPDRIICFPVVGSVPPSNSSNAWAQASNTVSFETSFPLLATYSIVVGVLGKSV